MTSLNPPVAWVFPGQGSQSVGMGRALAAADPAVAALFEQADQLLGQPLSEMIFHGPAERLEATDIQQPAILVTSIAMFESLRRSCRLPAPMAVAGHSLGQYSAAVAAGALPLAEALDLVAERGRLMQQHGRGAMAAILALETPIVAEVAAATGVELANINAPGQVTISGSQAGVEAAMALASERGARKVIRLPVSAAFHSSLMAPVVAGLRTRLAGVKLSDPRIPLISNVDARRLTDAAAVRQELLDHICAPVQWVAMIEALVTAGARQMIEIGPGRVLSGLIRRINREITLDDAESLLQAKE